jgi:hypothetical protein
VALTSLLKITKLQKYSYSLPEPFPVVIVGRPVRRESCLCRSESKINKQKYF